MAVDPLLSDNTTREWTGYGTLQNRDSALARWSLLASTAPDVPHRIKAQAYSCLATGWFDRAIEDPERWNIDALYRAGISANEAVSLGLISPGALRAGFSIDHQGFRRPEENRFPEVDTGMFERLTDLWEAIDMRMAEVNKVTAKRDAKVSKAPLQYVCAARDCGIQATKKSGLLRCGGKCPMPFKPSYCSKECQKMVRCPSSVLDFPIYSCLPYRTGNAINRFVGPTLQSRACFRSTPKTKLQRIRFIERICRRARTPTHSKDELQDTPSRYQ